MVGVVDEREEWPSLEPFLIVAEDARESAGRCRDDAGVGQQQRDRRRVLHQGSEPCDLVAGDLPPAAFGEVAHAQQQLVVEGRTDHLDEPPSIATADPELERCADLLRLHARDGEHRELQVVGVDEIETVRADGLVDAHREHALGGMVGPPDASLRVDHQHGIGQRHRDGGSRVAVFRRVRVARGGAR